MVLELDRKTLFPYPVYEAPTSIPYEPTKVLKRIFDLNKSESLKPIAINLYERSVDTKEKHTQMPNVGVELWNSERALVNHFLGNESIGITDTKSWKVLWQILTGNFDPRKTLTEINSLKLIPENMNPWEILRELMSISNDAQNPPR